MNALGTEQGEFLNLELDEHDNNVEKCSLEISIYYEPNSKIMSLIIKNRSCKIPENKLGKELMDLLNAVFIFFLNSQDEILRKRPRKDI